MKWKYKIGQRGIIVLNKVPQRYKIVGTFTIQDSSIGGYEVKYIGRKPAYNPRLKFIEESDFKPLKGKKLIV